LSARSGKGCRKKKLRDYILARLECPKLNCGACEDARELDGIIPECETDSGCPVPSLLPGSARAVEIHEKLACLHRLNIGSAILEMYGATVEDLELIVVIEQLAGGKDGNGGEGC
jgi:hypothetical protein